MDPMIKRLAISIWESLDNPVGQRLIDAAERGDWMEVATTKIHPGDYSDSGEFHRAYQCAELLRKYPGLPVKVDRAAAALKIWHDAESQCYFTNERLSPFIYGASQDEGLIALIRAVRKEVKHLLGSWTVPCEGRFGPGSTYHDKGKYSLLPDKLASCPTRTPNNFIHLIPHVGTEWARLTAEKFGRLFDTVPGNRFSVVLKDALVDRGISIETSINLYWQLAYGDLMKQRLKRRGLDLYHGQSKHSDMARSASLTGLQATIDLRTASDTMCANLVQLGLPEDWFLALSELRSPKTFLPHDRLGDDGRKKKKGAWFKIEKYSSMGNGYTFELETLIFASIAGAVIRLMGGCPEYGSSISVYGDDIIVDTPYAQNVLAALRFFGFTPNERKTFTDGPFRESCGGDFFEGVCVNVFRLTSVVETPSDWITVANGIRRIWYSEETDTWVACKKAWHLSQDQIPRPIRSACRGPVRLGDLVIHDVRESWKVQRGLSLKELGIPVKVRGTVNGVPNQVIRLVTETPSDTLWVKTWRPVAKSIPWEHWTEDVQLAARIYISTEARNGYTGRDAVSGFKFSWASVT